MTTEFDEVLEQAFAALDQIARGDSTGYKAMYSRRDDITLANPFGGVGRGWNDVGERLDRAASVFTDGRATGFEIVTQAVMSELAYTVAIESIEAKVGGQPELEPIAVRVTCVYRLEDSGWKLVHRHADPRVNPQTVESVLHP